MKKTVYHGSPYGGLKSFDEMKGPVFFTEHRPIAVTYATRHRIGAQYDPGTGGKTPTVYKTEVDPGNILDFRDPSVREAYEAYRKEEWKTLPAEDRWMYPPVRSKGFLSNYTQLPQYGHVHSVLRLFEKHGHPYHSVWIDEGSEPVSLAVVNPKGRTKILEWQIGDALLVGAFIVAGVWIYRRWFRGKETVAGSEGSAYLRGLDAQMSCVQ